ncbi:MAG TPA: META domain-containing protein [Candidatus Nanopelagicales bacterium]
MAQAQALPWGTQWDLVRAADRDVDWSAVHVTLGLQEQRAGGKAPVNRYFGACRELPDGQLELGPFGMTMMAGPPHAMAAEQAYVALLERVRTFSSNADELVLADADGAELLAFVPSADPEQQP